MKNKRNNTAKKGITRCLESIFQIEPGPKTQSTTHDVLTTQSTTHDGEGRAGNEHDEKVAQCTTHDARLIQLTRGGHDARRTTSYANREALAGVFNGLNNENERSHTFLTV